MEEVQAVVDGVKLETCSGLDTLAIVSAAAQLVLKAGVIWNIHG